MMVYKYICKMGTGMTGGIDILRMLMFLNYLLGSAVVVYALYIYLTKAQTIPLYIAMAIIIAGPLEDVLVGYVNRLPAFLPGEKEKYVKIIDNVTSIIFLALLGLAVVETGLMGTGV